MNHKMFALAAFAAAVCAYGGPAVIGGQGAAEADHRLESRRHEGIPSVAVDPRTGRLWATWYGGITPNEDHNNYLVLATSADGGKTWKEVLCYDPDGAGPVRAFDCELWVAPDGKLRWIWTERTVILRGAPRPDGKPSDAGWWAGHSDRAAIKKDRLMMMTLDAGKEPAAPYPAPREIGRGVMMCKPIAAKNGDWVLPVSRWYEEESAGLLVSKDGGKSFEWTGAASVPEKVRTFDEHCVVEMRDGRFKIWIRTNGGEMVSDSSDRGRTWSKAAKANFKAPPTRHAVRRLASGNILLIAHGAIDENPGRSKLTAFVSSDEGETWRGGLMLDERNNSSYPDADQGPDGTIYAVWDNDRCGKREILFARFTEEDVLAGKPVSKKCDIGTRVSSAPKGSVTFLDPLPPGAVKPLRWLRRQLELQRDGLTGHAEEIYEDIGKSDWLTNAGRGGEFGWERGPYYARGLQALAFALDDAGLKAKADRWAEAFYAGQKESGDIGPRAENWWANMLVLHFMRDRYEALRDARALEFLGRYFAFLEKRLPEKPLKAASGQGMWAPWACARGADMLGVILWYGETAGTDRFRQLAKLVAEQTAPWTDFYLRGAPNIAYQHHIVNFNQGLKAPAMLWRATGDARHKGGYLAATDPCGWAARRCGRPDGMFNGMEQLATRSPSDATELCAVVERIISCSVEISVFGTVRAADDMERAAYNTLPSTLAPDCKGVRYYNLLNQPKCANEPLGYFNNGSKLNGNVISPDSGYGCCRSNFHIGWPKFVQSMWMSTPGGGLAAVAFGPCRVKAKTNAGETEFEMDTDYPFGDKVTIRCTDGSGYFPLLVRIPSWCRRKDAGKFAEFAYNWKPGREVTLNFSSDAEAVGVSEGAVAVVRGPLVYSFAPKAEEKITKDRGNGFTDREMRAAEPWNWALDLRPGEKIAGEPVFSGTVPDQPFAPGAAPVSLEVPAMLTDFGMWGLFQEGGNKGVAYAPPACPVPREGKTEKIRLVPMGSAQLRITAFPALEK